MALENEVDHSEAEISDIVEGLTGHSIVSGGLDSEYEGFHLKLDNGKILIFTGAFVISVYTPQEVTWQ